VWTIGDSRMPVVGKATHVGILRTSIFIGNDSSCFKHFLWNMSIISRFFPVGVNNSRPYKRTGITYIFNIWIRD
jgi:hypothetical protein